jgi:hypothetical protein
MAGRQIEVRRVPTLIAATFVESSMALRLDSPSEKRITSLESTSFATIKDLKMERFSASDVELKLGGDGFISMRRPLGASS